jgi:rfaE bifunctional protein nucleotidyltransferase chain/domain
VTARAPGPGKVLSEAALVDAVEAHRRAGRRVVFTNGAFDLLHVGHARMLEEAAREGDVLVVAVNADAAVRAAKGPGRPVVPADERAELVAALAVVDHVVVFDDPTVDRLLRLLRPDVHAKGRDYDEASLPEGATDRALGVRRAFVGDRKAHASRTLAERLAGGTPPGDRAVEVTAGRARGTGLAPRVATLVERGLLDLDRLVALEGTEVHRHASRVVRRVALGDEVVYVKVERAPKRLGEAVVEMRNHLALRAAGFRAPEPWVALSGKDAGGSRVSVLVTREEPGVALDAHLARVGSDGARAQGWAEALGRAVRALHTARFLPVDLLAHHVLLDGPPSGGLRSIAFLDLARVPRASGRSGPSDAAPGLAALALSLRPCSSRRFRYAVLRGYLGGSLGGARPFLRAVERRIRRVASRGTFRRMTEASR